MALNLVYLYMYMYIYNAFTCIDVLQLKVMSCRQNHTFGGSVCLALLYQPNLKILDDITNDLLAIYHHSNVNIVLLTHLVRESSGQFQHLP